MANGKKQKLEVVRDKSAFDIVREALATINFESAVAVYVQIEHGVLNLVCSGKLKPNDQLPSVRELSEKLQVNPNTVAKSYRDLEVMGILYTRRGMGVFVDKDARKASQFQGLLAKHTGSLHEAVASLRDCGLSLDDIQVLATSSFESGMAPYAGMPASVQTFLIDLKRSKAA